MKLRTGRRVPLRVSDRYTAPEQRAAVHLAAGSALVCPVSLDSSTRQSEPSVPSRAQPIKQHHVAAGMRSGSGRGKVTGMPE